MKVIPETSRATKLDVFIGYLSVVAILKTKINYVNDYSCTVQKSF